MASTSYKAVAIAQSLLSDLNQRGPLAFTMSTATDGNPVLSTGNGSAGQQNIVIKVQNYLQAQNAAATTATAPLPYLDELGNAANTFSPTTISISLEQISGNSGTIIVLAKNLMPVLGECALRGADVRMLLTANGTAPTAGAGTLASDFNELQYPGLAQN